MFKCKKCNNTKKLRVITELSFKISHGELSMNTPYFDKEFENIVRGIAESHEWEVTYFPEDEYAYSMVIENSQLWWLYDETFRNEGNEDAQLSFVRCAECDSRDIEWD